MNIDVRCVCGQSVEATPPPPEDDDGVYVPFDLSHEREDISHEDIDSGRYGKCGRSESSVVCKCGNTTRVVVKIDLVERQEVVGCEALNEIFNERPSGKQVHVTEHVTRDWKRDTYLYKDNEEFRFEQYVSNQHHEMLRIASKELREHVTKLLPVLFTPEELKTVLSGEGLPPGSTPPRPMS